jgi:hypothetical protein
VWQALAPLDGCTARLGRTGERVIDAPLTAAPDIGDVRVRVPLPRPCRVCGEASYATDDDGPVHLCCAIHASPCPSCAASKMLNAEQRRRVRARTRRGAP